MSDERFVADGHERLTSSDEYKEARAAIVAAVQARYAEPLAGAGAFRRIVLLLRRRREISRELAKIAPPDALYLQSR